METFRFLGRRCRAVLFWLAAFFLFFFLFLLGFFALDARASRQVYDKAVARFAPAAGERSPVDFAALMQVNPEIWGWLEYPALGISYPLVQGQDNQYYLNHLYDGSPGAAGALFLDAAGDPGLEDTLTILYGHNMGDGSMLGTLPQLLEPEADSVGPLFLYLPEEARPREYRLILLVRAAPDASFYFTPFSLGSQEYIALLEGAAGEPLLAGAAPDPDRPALVLSTCTRDGRQRLAAFYQEIVF